MNNLYRSLLTHRANLDYACTHGSTDQIDSISEELNLCRDIAYGKTIIVSAFPGTGKTHFFENSRKLTILDSDSSKFDKNHFPKNYIEHILENIGKVDVVLVSSHKIVRDALVEAGIPFILVYPKKELKAEYIERYKQRGNLKDFVDLIEKNWDSWIDGCSGQTKCFKHQLSSNEYLSSFLSE